MAYKIQQMGLGGILDQAIAITKDHFGLLFTIMLLLLVPFNLINGFVTLSAMSGFMPQTSMENVLNPDEVEVPQPEFPMWFLPWSIVAGLLYLLVVLPLTNAAVIQAVARLYLGQPVTATEAMRHGLRRLLPLIGTSILMGLAIMGGFILLIIPGILCMIWFGLSQHVTVLEDIAGSPALGRSKRLVGPHWTTFLALMLIIGVISYAAQAVSEFIVTTMGLKPSPSGESFRFFDCHTDRRHGKRWYEMIAVYVRHSDGMESRESEGCFRMPPS